MHVRKIEIKAPQFNHLALLNPHLDNLARFMIPLMPNKPTASQTLRSITFNRYSSALPLWDALTCPWISLDSAEFRNAIVIDVDHDDVHHYIEQLPRGFPKPTIVVDPWSGRSHVFFMLSTPVFMGDTSRNGPRKMCDYAGRILAHALRGTLMPHRGLIKSPWGETQHLIGHKMKRGNVPCYLWEYYKDESLMWHTIPGDLIAVELSTILDLLVPIHKDDLDKIFHPNFSKNRPEPSATGRNCYLFDLTRWWCYDRCEKDESVIIDYMMELNEALDYPLPESEVRSSGRSISRFMNTRYHPRNKAKLKRDVTDGMTLREKQAQGGRVTAENRAKITLQLLIETVAQLIDTGAKITQAIIGDESNTSRSTVQRYWTQLCALYSNLSGSSLPSTPLPSTDLEPLGVNEPIDNGENLIKEGITHTNPLPVEKSSTTNDSKPTSLDNMTLENIYKTNMTGISINNGVVISPKQHDLSQSGPIKASVKDIITAIREKQRLLLAEKEKNRLESSFFSSQKANHHVDTAKPDIPTKGISKTTDADRRRYGIHRSDLT